MAIPHVFPNQKPPSLFELVLAGCLLGDDLRKVTSNATVA